MSIKTILATAYAINPYKGSEDGMGWNFIYQIARHNKVIAVTRKNNRPHIEKYQKENPSEIYKNMQFLYHDLPYYMRFWKKGGRGAMLYFYMWQFSMPCFIKKQKIDFDIAHNLNFHNDWTPSFLWKLKKPFIWGPIGHHPPIPEQYILSIYGKKAYRKDRLRWKLKNTFWKLDFFLKKCSNRSSKILAMNSSVASYIKQKNKIEIMPSVSSEDVEFNIPSSENEFIILSAGRFVPLKGFDITVKSFAQFFNKLSSENQKKAKLILVGKGEEENLIKSIIRKEKIENNVEIIEWIEREKLQDLYRKSHIFLFPSHEGAGMVVSEALSHALPVLCFDNFGPGEFVNEKCGSKVPYGDYKESINAFSKHLENLFYSPEKLKKKSLEARKHFKENFEWNIKGNRLRDIYNNLDF